MNWIDLKAKLLKGLTSLAFGFAAYAGVDKLDPELHQGITLAISGIVGVGGYFIGKLLLAMKPPRN